MPEVTRPVWRRRTGRVVPVDRDGRVLLLHGFEPARPDWWFWFTIGGAVETGETVRQAAARELAEEVGIVVAEELLGEPYLSASIEFDWGGRHIEQHQTFYAIALEDAPEADLSGLDGLERGTIDAAGWVDPEDLAAGRAEPVAPELVDYVRQAVTAVRGAARSYGLTGTGDGHGNGRATSA